MSNRMGKFLYWIFMLNVTPECFYRQSTVFSFSYAPGFPLKAQSVHLLEYKGNLTWHTGTTSGYSVFSSYFYTNGKGHVDKSIVRFIHHLQTILHQLNTLSKKISQQLTISSSSNLLIRAFCLRLQPPFYFAQKQQQKFGCYIEMKILSKWQTPTHNFIFKLFLWLEADKI